MRPDLIMVVILVVVSCKSQERVKFKYTLKPPFETQEAQERYWCQEIFKREYKREVYKKFNGQIESRKHLFLFQDGDTVRTLSDNAQDIELFMSGLLYPKLFCASNMVVSGIQELGFLSNNPKVRRYYCYIDCEEHVGNQTLAFVFELTNEEGTCDLQFTQFIKNARLTFLKEGWVVV